MVTSYIMRQVTVTHALDALVHVCLEKLHVLTI
jgi:hypothetical protein